MTSQAWRQRLTAVHSWAGLLLGLLLFTVFWTGSLIVIDREIDRWMMPATRLAAPPPTPALDALQPVVRTLVPAGARQWRIDWATPRTPVLRLTWVGPDGQRGQALLDPHRLTVLPDPGTLGATGFLYPLHYGLHLDWQDLGKWLVGAAGIGMLVLLVSGTLIHRKLLADFFTFRPRKRLARSSLDLHNLSGVAALPFHLAITLSGLVIFWQLYFPQAHEAAFKVAAAQALAATGPASAAAPAPGAAATRAQLQADNYGRFQRRRLGASDQPLVSLDALVVKAQAHWGADAQPYFIRVWNPDDRQATVELRRSYAREVTMNLDQLFFDGHTGALLHRFEAAPVMRVQRFLSGLHFIQFQHGLLRALYLVFGLSGCLMIGTGLVHWLAARERRSAPGSGPPRSHALQAWVVAGTAGLIVATLVFLAANHLLPPQAALALGDRALDRAQLEVAAFITAWLVCLVQAHVRRGQAWRSQALAIAVLAAGCVVLDLWLTLTGPAPLQDTPLGVWQVNLLLAGLSAGACWAARRLRAGKP